MKAEISKDGQLRIWPDSNSAAYGLERWKDEFAKLIKEKQADVNPWTIVDGCIKNMHMDYDIE